MRRGAHRAWNYSILSDKVDRRREWHAKFNQGVMGRSLVKSCNQGENVALKCGYNLMIFWEKKGIDVENDTRGANGALTCTKFSPRFPFPRCSGYETHECVIPFGRRKPTTGVSGWVSKDRSLNRLFGRKVGPRQNKLEQFRKSWKRSTREKVQNRSTDTHTHTHTHIHTYIHTYA